jgi:hypothetical protein
LKHKPVNAELGLYSEIANLVNTIDVNKYLQSRIKFILGGDEKTRDLSYLAEGSSFEILNQEERIEFASDLHEKGIISDKEYKRIQSVHSAFNYGVGPTIDFHEGELQPVDLTPILETTGKFLTYALSQDLFTSFKINAHTGTVFGISPEFRRAWIELSAKASPASQLALNYLMSFYAVANIRVQNKSDKYLKTNVVKNPRKIFDTSHVFKTVHDLLEAVITKDDVEEAMLEILAGNIRLINLAPFHPAAQAAMSLLNYFVPYKAKQDAVWNMIGYKAQFFDIANNDRIINIKNVDEAADRLEPGTSHLFRDVLSNTPIRVGMPLKPAQAKDGPKPKYDPKISQKDIGFVVVAGVQNNPSGSALHTENANQMVNGAKISEQFVKFFSKEGFDFNPEEWFVISTFFIGVAGDDAFHIVPGLEHPEAFDREDRLIGNAFILNDSGEVTTIGKTIMSSIDVMGKTELRDADNPNYPLVFASGAGQLNAFYWGINNMHGLDVADKWAELYNNPDNDPAFFFNFVKEFERPSVPNTHGTNDKTALKQEDNMKVKEFANSLGKDTWELTGDDLMNFDPEIRDRLYIIAKANTLVSNNFLKSLPDEGYIYDHGRLSLNELRFIPEPKVYKNQDLIKAINAGVPISGYYYTGEQKEFSLLHPTLPHGAFINSEDFIEYEASQLLSNVEEICFDQHNKAVKKLMNPTEEEISGVMTHVFLWYYLNKKPLNFSENCEGSRSSRYYSCTLCLRDLFWVKFGYPPMGVISETSKFTRLNDYFEGDKSFEFFRFYYSKKPDIVKESFPSMEEEAEAFIDVLSQSYNSSGPFFFGNLKKIFETVKDSLYIDKNPSQQTKQNSEAAESTSKINLYGVECDLRIHSSFSSIVENNFKKLAPFVLNKELDHTANILPLSDGSISHEGVGACVDIEEGDIVSNFVENLRKLSTETAKVKSNLSSK